MAEAAGRLRHGGLPARPAAVRAERLAARLDADAGDVRTVEDPAFAEAFAAMLVHGMGRRHRRLVVFDTSRHSPQQMAAAVADALISHLKVPKNQGPPERGASRAILAVRAARDLASLSIRTVPKLRPPPWVPCWRGGRWSPPSGSPRPIAPAPHPHEVMRPALAIGCYRSWLPARPGAVIAAEAATPRRSAHLRHRWLDHVLPEAKRALASLAAPPVVTGWYTTPRLRDLAGPGGVVAAIDGQVRARLENKADFDHLLQQSGVRQEARIPAIRINGALPSLTELRRRLSTDRVVVVQAGATSGGRGTVIVTGEHDMAAAAGLAGPHRVAAFVDGLVVQRHRAVGPRP